jgi:prepilin-type N-terminal cleavage/methylation domain-containing protein
MSPAPRGPEACPRAAGFTLLEMLVTLTIGTLLLTTLWQAVFLSTRAEQALQSTSLAGARQAMQRQWLRDLIATAVQDGRADAFQGDSQRVLFASTEAIGWQAFPAGRVVIALQKESGRRAMQAVLLPQASGIASPAPPVVLLTWAGHDEGRFQFLDPAGAWVDAWPPPGDREGRLPRAVRVQLGSGTEAAWSAPIIANEPPRVRLSAFERL